MKKITRWSACALCSVLFASVSGAQTADPWAHGPLNPGFFGTVGVGTANGTTEIDGDFGAGGAPGSARYSSSAMTYDLFLGVALSGRWRIGAEVELMPAGQAQNSYANVGSTGTTAYYTLATAFYPASGVGLSLKANVGYGTVSYHAPVLTNGVPTGAGNVTLSGGGLAAGLGVAYEWRPGTAGFMIVGFANYVTLIPTVALSGDTQPWSGRTSLLQIGIGFGTNR